MGLNPRDLKRMFKRMGVRADIEELSDAEQVIVVHSDGRKTILDNPQGVTLIKLGGTQQATLSATGVYRVEEPEPAREEQTGEPFTEEDVSLVAQQTGVTPEEARAALRETNGDLAEAIMLIEQRKTGL